MRCFMVVFFLLGSVRAQSQSELTLKDTQGTVHKLSEYRGRVVVLNFWATWCIPCRQEMPIFVDVEKHYRDRGLIVLAASLDDSRM